MIDKLGMIINDIMVICKKEDIEFNISYVDIFESHELRLSKNNINFGYSIKDNTLDGLTHKYIIAEITHGIYDRLLVPSNSGELFYKIIDQITTLCNNTDIYTNYYFSDDLNICTFNFQGFGKKFSYAIDANEIRYGVDGLTMYEINYRIMKMYDAVRNEIG